jgi:spermidine synthase
VKKKNAPSAAAPHLPTPEISVGLRRYLFLTAGVCGAAVMIVEILGAKMLAPFLGTSHFVWTAQIAVTLVALACGYWAGGVWVDKSAKLGRLYWALIGAATYLCFATLVREPVAYACLNFNLALGSLMASTFLFFIPLFCLAMVSPFLVRVITASVNYVGGNVGRLSGVSTLGSVIGTILIGYVVIPLMPNSVTMVATAGALVVLSLGYLFGFSRKKSDVGPALTLAVFAGALGLFAVRMDRMSHPDYEEIYRGNSDFGMLQVIKKRDSGYLLYLNDYLLQNTYDPKSKKSVSMYTYLLHGLARAYTPKIDSALCIGLGIGIVPMQFLDEGVQRVDAVEINPAVVPLARKYFDLNTQHERLRIHIADGRQFLHECRAQYDTIILDAFLGDSSPSHLFSREAFEQMRRVLNPRGTVVINIFGGREGSDNFFTASLAKTLEAVFDDVAIHQSDGGNTFLVACHQGKLELKRPANFDDVHPLRRAEVQQAFLNVVGANPRRGIVLTDDYNPVEFYDAKNREIYRRNMAMSFKGR